MMKTKSRSNTVLRQKTKLNYKPRRRRNSKVKHFISKLEEDQILNDSVTCLTKQAIQTRSVNLMTPFALSKRKSLAKDMFTQPALSDHKLPMFSSASSSYDISVETGLNRDSLGKLLLVINSNKGMHLRKRQVKEIVRTSEDIMSQKYLTESRIIEKSQNKFKTYIVQKMIGTLRNPTHSDRLGSKSPLDSRRGYESVSGFGSYNQINQPRKSKRLTKYTQFYSKSKNRVMTEGYDQDTKSKIVHPLPVKGFTFLEYQGKNSAKKEFLDSNRLIKGYCSNLVKHQEVILNIAKEGTRNRQLLKRCLDQALVQVG